MEKLGKDTERVKKWNSPEESTFKARFSTPKCE